MYAIRSNEYGMVRHQSVLQNQTAIKTAEESRLFAPYCQDRFLYQGGFDCVRRAVRQWFPGLRVLIVKRFRRDYD